MIKPSKFLITILLLTSLLLFTTRAIAASPTSLTLSPAILEQVVPISTNSLSQVTLSNNTDTPIPIKSSIEPYGSLTSSSTSYNPSSWITIDPADFILQPHESKLIHLTIKPSPDALPGGHYASLIFQPLLPEGVVADSSAIARVGAILMLNVPGKIEENLSLTPSHFPWIITSLPAEFSFSLKNGGTTHLLPGFTLTLRNSHGQPLVVLNPTPGIILPNESKAFPTTLETLKVPGLYSLTGSIHYGTPSNKSINLPIIHFWYLPLIPLFFLTLLTLILIWSIVRYKRIILAINILRNGTYDHKQT